MLQIKRQLQTLIAKGAYPRAIGFAAEFVRRNPESAAAYCLLAQAEEAAGYIRAAIQSISHAVDRAPEVSDYRIVRARLHLKDRHRDGALADINALIALGQAAGNPHFIHEAMACRDELLEHPNTGHAVRQAPVGPRTREHG